jgi:hypothetical protein
MPQMVDVVVIDGWRASSSWQEQLLRPQLVRVRRMRDCVRHLHLAAASVRTVLRAQHNDGLILGQQNSSDPKLHNIRIPFLPRLRLPSQNHVNPLLH